MAVKALRGETADRRRFAAEARLLASLDHPHLVHLYDAIDGDDVAVLVMELVDGPSLAEVLRAGAVPTDTAARLGAELAGCLAYLHAQGVVHRDVKPANILIGSDGHARLADFGIARLVDGTRLTVAGQAIGTPSYMAPEQLTGAAAGPPADVYALGLVLLEALTGRRAFPGDGHEAVVARLARGPVIPSTGLGGRWPPLLAAMTSRDPGHRPPAATVAAAVRGLPVDRTEPVVVAGAPPRRRPARLTRPVALAAALAATAAVAAAVLGASALAHGSRARSAPPVVGRPAPVPAPATTTAPTAATAPVTAPPPPATATTASPTVAPAAPPLAQRGPHHPPPHPAGEPAGAAHGRGPH